MMTVHLVVSLNVVAGAVVHHRLARLVWTELVVVALTISTVNAFGSAMEKVPVIVAGRRVAVALFVPELVMEVVPDPDLRLAIVLPVLAVTAIVTVAVTVMGMTEELWAACFSYGL